MTGRIFISADDLTGALDTGVQFAKAGLHVRVTPTPAFIPGEEDVLVVCTQTRHLPAQKARAVVGDVFAHAKQAGSYGVYFKKLDSTLRGNVGSELEGMARELFGTRVKLDGNANGGKLTLYYYSADDLQRIWDVMEMAGGEN